MQLSVRTLRVAALAALIAAGLAACGDDDGNNPPATPPAPTGLTATAASETSIVVNWTAVSGATGYVLERAEASAPGSFTQVGGSLAAATYTDNAVTPGTAYSYRVAAVNGAGTGTFSSTVSVTTAGLKVATLTGNITTDRTLFADTLYTLSGYVKVGNGRTLTIQPGTTHRRRRRCARELALDPSRLEDRRARHGRRPDRLHLLPGRRPAQAGRLGWSSSSSATASSIGAERC